MNASGGDGGNGGPRSHTDGGRRKTETKARILPRK